MTFDPPLLPARLIRRYKRFLADVRLEDGEVLTVHVANSGSMKTCLGEDWPVMLSDSRNPKRKLRYSLEMLHDGQGWIGVNTALPNALVEEAILSGTVPGFDDWSDWRREVRYGSGSRIDLLGRQGERLCYVEVKNVTLLVDGQPSFPDAVTERGRKHLEELTAMVREGHRAVLFLCVQRQGGDHFLPARAIDPAWCDALEQAMEAGVEVLAWRFLVTPEGIAPQEELALEL